MPKITDRWADEQKRQDWYQSGAAYWAATEPTNDGVLGGYGRVHDADVADSLAFVAPLLASRPKRALDVGAGIGRVTGGLLLGLCDSIDLLEECGPFLSQARALLAHAGDRVQFFCVSMQDFSPEAGAYDLIWVQWCVGSLSDADLIAFLSRCKAGLEPGGLIVIKDNVLHAATSCKDKLEQGPRGALYLVDNDDNSVCYCLESLPVNTPTHTS